MLTEKDKNSIIEDYGQVLLSNGKEQGKIQLMTIIGEIEGHDVLPNTSKSTKYEHILPQLAAIEDNSEEEYDSTDEADSTEDEDGEVEDEIIK